MQSFPFRPLNQYVELKQLTEKGLYATSERMGAKLANLVAFCLIGG